MSSALALVAVVLASVAIVLATIANRRWAARPTAGLQEAGRDHAAGPSPDPTALRHVALVRYDAFADVGGRLSYSVAVLDDTGSGLVLTTLSGKSDVRTYVRTISAGIPDGSLTAEERQAIDAAVGSGQ